MTSSGNTPWFSDRGVLIGVLGILVGAGLSYYFYLAGKTYRDPAFTTRAGTVLSVPQNVGGYPVRLVDANTGEPIAGFVIDQRFVLQNRGTESIRAEHILVPLSIGIEADDLRLLSARVAAATRLEVVQPRVSLGADDRIGVQFSILEPGDGFEVVAVFTSTAEKSTASISGAIEGVTQFSQTDGPIIPGGSVIRWIVVALGALFIVGICAVGLWESWRSGRWMGVAKGVGSFFLFIAAMIGLVVAIAWLGALFRPRAIQPPEMTPIPVESVNPASD